MAKALICSDLKDDHDPCNECEFCTDINEGKLIDLIEIDAASNRGIDEVRDLKEKINFQNKLPRQNELPRRRRTGTAMEMGRSSS